MVLKFGFKSKHSVVTHGASKTGSGQGGVAQDDCKKKTGPVRKLMLSTQLWGVEALCNFEQLYMIPILQMLGMPISLITLIGLVSGLTTLTFLPLVGWLSDRGSNQHRRKIVTVAFSTSLVVLAMVLIITANMIHLTDVLASNANMTSGIFDVSTSNQIAVNESSSKSGASDGHNFSIVSGTTSSDGALKPSQENVSMEMVSGNNQSATSGIPFKAALGMLGFVAGDIAYDSSNCFVKSYVLSCSPRDEHTSILVMGLFMASAGGLSTALLGVVDIPSLLGLSHLKGVGLTIQTSFQGMVIIFCTALGTVITLGTGHKQRGQQKHCSMDSKGDINQSRDENLAKDEHLTSTVVETLENNNVSFDKSGVYCDKSLGMLREDSALKQERTPLLEERDQSLHGGNDFGASQTISASYNSNTNLTSLQTLTKELSVDGTAHTNVVESKEATDKKNIPNNNASRLKIKVVFLCLSTCFCAGSIYCLTMTTSDFVGKAIFEGDPDAYPGSEGFLRYKQGLRLASSGLIVYYGSYLLVNFVQPRLLAVLGYRVEFMLFHLLMSTMLLTVTFFTRVDVYFLLTVVAGLQRACYQSIPYAVANDIINSDQSSQDGKSKTGLAMSLVTLSLPLSYCTLFPFIGPVEHWTGSVSAPFWMGAGFSCLAVLFFVCIGKI